jgi:hypothetical protein
MDRATFLRLMVAGVAAGPSLWGSPRGLAGEPVGVASAGPCADPQTNKNKKKLVLIAGRPSHPPMMHEFRAGTILLEKRLQAVPGLVVERHDGGWVADEETLEDAAGVAIFSDGGGGHPAIQEQRLERLERLIGRGMGFGCLHFGVEVPKDRGGPEFQRWIGGYYEHEWSCNPIWDAKFEDLPDHPMCRGVRPFDIRDEWYFNMRFADGFSADQAVERQGVRFQPILVARPSDQVRNGPYVYPRGPYPHIQEAAGRPEAVMWAVDRPDGGHGFGFTGGHFHINWQHDDFRRLILNALVWLAGVEVPAGGIESPSVDDEEIRLNLDPK